MQIAILGFGTVGRGVYDILTQDHPDIHVKYIVDRHPEKTKGVLATVTRDYESIIDDQDIDVIVELLGGKDNAYPYVKAALEKGKHVVTANKALISACFKELHDLAQQQDKQLRYEASVGAAINIIDPLYTISEINQISRIEGIINGSTNYILSALDESDMSLDEVLASAREKGYLEAHSNDDMDGLDLMRKINILAMIAFHQSIDEADILRIPLSKIKQPFYDYLKAKSLMMKYVAYASQREDGLSLSVLPVVIDQSHPYALIKGTDNIITLYGKYHEKQQFIGCGAGRYPTASAVVYDLLKIRQKQKQVLKLDQSRNVIMDDTQKSFLVLRNQHMEIIKSDLKTIAQDPSIDGFALMDVDTLNMK